MVKPVILPAYYSLLDCFCLSVLIVNDFWVSTKHLIVSRSIIQRILTWHVVNGMWSVQLFRLGSLGFMSMCTVTALFPEYLIHLNEFLRAWLIRYAVFTRSKISISNISRFYIREIFGINFLSIQC